MKLFLCLVLVLSGCTAIERFVFVDKSKRRVDCPRIEYFPTPKGAVMGFNNDCFY